MYEMHAELVLTVSSSWPHALAQSSDQLAGPAQRLIHADLQTADGVATCISDHLHHHKAK